MTIPDIVKTFQVQPLPAWTNDQTQALPLTDLFHLNYISGPKAELWKALIERGILDAYGRVTEKFSSMSLPSLTEEELKIIEEEIFKKFDLVYGDGKNFRISMGSIFRAIIFQITKEKKNFRVCGTNLIGGFVNYCLFERTDYAKRVFQALHIEDLYNPTLFKKTGKRPADIDVRMWIKFFSGFTTQDLIDELILLTDMIIAKIVDWFEKNDAEINKEELFNNIVNSAFETLCTVSTYSNGFQILSFKNSPFDLLLFTHLERTSVFTCRDLYLPLDSFLDKKQKTNCTPQSFRGTPLESFFHFVLGFTVADNPETIDEKGCPRFISLQVKGNVSMQIPQDENAMSLGDALFNTTEFKWIQNDPLVIGLLSEETKKYLNKHHANDPLAQLCFVFKMATYLHNRIDPANAHLYLCTHLSALQFGSTTFETKIATCLKTLLVEKKISVSFLQDFLQICAFLHHACGYENHDHYHVNAWTEDFRRPVLQMHIGDCAIEVPCAPPLALERIAFYSNQDPKTFSDSEKDLYQLFLLLCPPTTTHTLFDEKMISKLGINNKSLIDSTLLFANSFSPLLNYIGIVYLAGIQVLHSDFKRAFAEKHTLLLLSFHEKNQAIKEQLELLVGKNAIPALDDHQFEQKWIETLFEEQRGSQQTAYLLWKDMTDRGEAFEFSFQLIQKLVYYDPNFALSLFSYLQKKGALVKLQSQSIDTIVQCAKIIKNLSKRTQGHDNLMVYMAKDLSTLLAIDEMGWFCIIALQQENSPLLSQINNNALEQQLFNNMWLRWMQNDPQVIGKLNEELKNWLDKNYQNDSLSKLYFVLKAATFLQAKVEPSVLDTFLNEQLSSLIFKSHSLEIKIAQSLQMLFLKTKLSFSILQDCLQLFAFLAYTRHSEKREDFCISVLSENAPRFLQIEMSHGSFQVPCQIVDAIKRLETYVKTDPKSFYEAQKELNHLAMLFCPPNVTSESIDDKILLEFEMTPTSLMEASLLLIECRSVFLNYVGILLLSGIKGIDPQLKKECIQRHTLSILHFNEKSEPVRQQLEFFLGKDTIPSFVGGKFEQRWISALFESQENKSQELGQQLLNEMKESQENVKFLCLMIQQLAHAQPDLSLKLFCDFQKKNASKQLPNEVVTMILECARIVENHAQRTADHEKLLDYLAQELPAILDHPQFRAPQKLGAFSKTLLWIAQWCKKRKDLKTAIFLADLGKKKHYFERGILHIELEFSEAYKNKNVKKIKTLLKELTTKDLPKEEMLHYLIRYFELDPHFYSDTFFTNLFGEYIKSDKVFSPKTYEKAAPKFNIIALNSPITLAEKFAIAEAFAKKAPAECQMIVDSILSCSFTLQKGSGNHLELIKELAKTTFFDHIPVREAFQTLIREVVETLMCLSIQDVTNKEHALLIHDFLKRYTSDFKTINPYLLSQSIQILCRLEPKLVFPLYELLKKHNIIDITKDANIYQNIYCTVIIALARSKDEKILTILSDPLYPKVFSCIYDTEVVFVTYAHLISGCAPFAKNKPDIIRSISTAYEYASSIFALTLQFAAAQDIANKAIGLSNDNNVNVQVDTKDNYYSFMAGIDIDYLELLYNNDDPLFIEERSKKLETLLAKGLDVPAAYWLKWGRVINLLCEEKTLADFDKCLELLDIWLVPYIDFDKVIPFLKKHCTDETSVRALRGIQLWTLAMRSHWKNNETSWEFGHFFIKKALEAKRFSFEAHIIKTITYITENITDFAKITNFKTQYLQLNLQVMELTGREGKGKQLAPKITEALQYLVQVYQDESSPQILTLLPKAIINSSHFDPQSFHLESIRYWALIEHSYERVNKEKKIAITTEQGFEFKKKFILLMVEEFNNSQKMDLARRDLQIRIGACIASLRKDSNFKQHNEEIEQLALLYKELLTKSLVESINLQ